MPANQSAEQERKQDRFCQCAQDALLAAASPAAAAKFSSPQPADALQPALHSSWHPGAGPGFFSPPAADRAALDAALRRAARAPRPPVPAMNPSLPALGFQLPAQLAGAGPSGSAQHERAQTLGQKLQTLNPCGHSSSAPPAAGLSNDTLARLRAQAAAGLLQGSAQGLPQGWSQDALQDMRAQVAAGSLQGGQQGLAQGLAPDARTPSLCCKPESGSFGGSFGGSLSSASGSAASVSSEGPYSAHSNAPLAALALRSPGGLNNPSQCFLGDPGHSSRGPLPPAAYSQLGALRQSPMRPGNPSQGFLTNPGRSLPPVLPSHGAMPPTSASALPYPSPQGDGYGYAPSTSAASWAGYGAGHAGPYPGASSSAVRPGLQSPQHAHLFLSSGSPADKFAGQMGTQVNGHWNLASGGM